MIVIDTSALTRFFTNDDGQKAEKTAKLLESDESVFIPDAVFIELEYVLTKLYSASRQDLLKVYHFLMSHQNIKTGTDLPKAVNIFQLSTVSLADCLIASQSYTGLLASFDQKLLKLPGVKPYW